MKPILYRLFALSAGLLAGGATKAENCADLLPGVAQKSETRAIRAEDLIELRDIGPAGVSDTNTTVFRLSPDGTKLVLQLRRADVASNQYCMGVMVVDLLQGSPPHLVNKGGEFIRQTYSVGGFAAHTSPGTPLATTPKWSPDGRWLAFIRRDYGITQLWRANADGSGSGPLTHGLFDVENFAWSADGKSVIFSARPGLVSAEADLEREGREGFLFDDRFEPISGNRPLVRGIFPVAFFSVALDGGALSQVSEQEGAAVLSITKPEIATDADAYAASQDGDVAWTEAQDRQNVMSETGLRVKTQAGMEYRCDRVECNGVTNLWWIEGQGKVAYMRREGWRKSDTAIYAWSLGHSDPVRVLLTDDALLGCEVRGQRLFCAHENSNHPRNIVEISLKTGQLKTVFEPNPDFSQVRLGTIERLEWTNAFGIATFGDLVLPPDHKTGDKHPLVVVLYESRGFLRGGTGHEYPIQLLAAKGYAVLSVQNPPSIGMTQGATSWEEVNRLDRVEWGDRRSIQSAIETGVARVIQEGVVDPHRLGITGLSDGASSVQFALINSKLFGAAAMSSCCEDIPAATYLDGPAASRGLHAMGYPSLSKPDDAFWMAMSVRANARTLTTPLLIQTPDREYLAALEGVAALREFHQPVELYVFPDENHVKWQPAHLAAVYSRTVDWFDFWLQGKTDPEPSKAAQYKRWEALRSERQSASPGQ
ncbi:Atxe2 family lasso peptide isopeptidase [Asticcacaulis benevestitus]|uniref:Peptidase S9 prolyl oligopeptidase catalytic domain-containing protein n=1 Tax=Asticcacaulis benevestitus DSM 16100 = ATCC BAA-896 TaxID=1121022 RepID=V4Q459_9CAUL|nr:Atxe2 family lasso peptide isopeptidase [Asticcacaulis benevestitus]ESQ92585.1 hypothetical protein ABENE_08075 [Asticcacaulis benevestitus DSM 16100 = ATCC BAA-896]